MSEQVLGRKIANMPLWVRATAIGSLGVGVSIAAGACSSEGSSASGAGGANQVSNPAIPSTSFASVCPEGAAPKGGVCAQASRSEAVIPTMASTSPEDVKFVFNSECLPAGSIDPHKPACSNVIQVYSNPFEGGEGTAEGTFMDGDSTATIECYVVGRDVTRSGNEYSGDSQQWYHLSVGGHEYYATGAYGAPAAHATIP